jgi:hypothetical protein
MRERIVDLSYLNENEIVEFYELFFGKILLKKPDFSYYKNLALSLSKENTVKSILERINQHETEILQVLSKHIIVPYEYVVDKLHVFLNIPTTIISKSISTLIAKKYIFLRDNVMLIVPDVYFYEEENEINFAELDCPEDREYDSKILTDINNLINYFASKEIKFSNSHAIYKKDATLLEEAFSKYTNLKRIEYNVVSYFYALVFKNSDDSINFESLKKYFHMLPLDRILYFFKITFPSVYAIIDYFYSFKKDVKINIQDLKTLWFKSFLLSEYKFMPIRFNFNSILHLLKMAGIMEIEEEDVIIKYYVKDHSFIDEDVRVSSNFNLYINANSLSNDFYLPALFADFVKYNKIVEYEITENSVRRGVIAGINYATVLEYFNKFGIQISGNVETTLKQWFDKNASYYFVSGTLFFCDGEEKGYIIKTLIKNGMIKAHEIKKDEVFLIPEEEKNNFFSVIDKSGINYYQKDILKEKKVEEPVIYDLKKFFK